MKQIKLTQNKYTLVDDKNFDWLNQWKWYYHKGYAARVVINKKKRIFIFMHRLINKTPQGIYTDHINHNTLDNRKSNLRSVNISQNGMNRKRSKNNTSGYTGICWSKEMKKWQAQIKINKKLIYLGQFKILEEAIKIRKEAEKKYFILPPESFPV